MSPRPPAKKKPETEELLRPLAGFTDEDLLGRCQRGDLPAFEEIYRRYQRPILAYIYQITRDYDDAACVAQDVFLKVFDHLDRFDTTRRFSTWFYTIARNAAIDYLQARRRRVMVTFSDLDREEGEGVVAATAAAPHAPVDGLLSGQEAVGHLRIALAKLPQIYREIVELIVFQEKSYEDASAILGGVSLGTLRSRMFHALRHLRDSLTQVAGGDGGDLL